ncbi:MAG: hypothetical protein WC438_04910 [Candidatus Pacearchaeota archaeon]
MEYTGHYNIEALGDFIKLMGIGYETDRLAKAGLEDSQLASIIFSVFNPEEINTKSPWRYLFANNEKQTKTPRNFRLIMNKYGIGTNEYLTERQLSTNFNISRERCRQIIRRFKNKILLERKVYLEEIKKEIYHLGLEKICPVEEQNENIH